MTGVRRGMGRGKNGSDSRLIAAVLDDRLIAAIRHQDVGEQEAARVLLDHYEAHIPYDSEGDARDVANYKIVQGLRELIEPTATRPCIWCAGTGTLATDLVCRTCHGTGLAPELTSGGSK